jgi:hypothetical protein
MYGLGFNFGDFSQKHLVTLIPSKLPQDRLDIKESIVSAIN